ncbi:hypothetical protein F4801DRAFT_176468 [Xylaria longipes]|nr:hypothetical protein F4801DRAFT_176468 [Xylaria longipes]
MPLTPLALLLLSKCGVWDFKGTLAPNRTRCLVRHDLRSTQLTGLDIDRCTQRASIQLQCVRGEESASGNGPSPVTEPHHCCTAKPTMICRRPLPKFRPSLLWRCGSGTLHAWHTVVS